MAAELCRVGLWLEALEPGKPLSFLDRHIRVGNSLLGATPELIEAGLPDAAFKPIQGDDKNTCSELRKRNKTEREYGQRDLGLVAESDEEYDSLATRSRSIDHAPDGTLEDIRRKDAQFRRMQESEDFLHVHQVADAWCAAFVWPKRPDATDALTTDTLRRLREDPNALAPAQRHETKRIAERYQFFHWHLAFPEVFAAGGFDCVLGNPPWERREASGEGVVRTARPGNRERPERRHAQALDRYAETQIPEATRQLRRSDTRQQRDQSPAPGHRPLPVLRARRHQPLCGVRRGRCGAS